MRVWLCLAVIVAFVVVRGVVFVHHDAPRGDVLLDVGVTRSLLAGDGFESGFTRGTAFVVGEGEVPPQNMADQHAPLWPLIGAATATVFGVDPFTGLQIASFIAGFALLLATWRLVDRLTEGGVGVPDGLPALGAALVAAGYVAIDASANGSLYAAQALGVVLLVDHLGSSRPSALCLGLLLGGLWALNHQCLVLLPVPLVVLLVTARGRTTERSLGGAAAVGLAAIAIAAAVQVPWWWRNVEVFGSATYSVNPLYLLYRLGVVPELAVEAGGPVARFPADVPWLTLMVGGVKSWLASNVLYVFVTGLFAWPFTMALAAAGLVPTGLAGLRTGDRRAVALVVTLLVLLAVSVVWPATKLRYLVPLTPLVVALGVAALAHRGSRAWRSAALAVWIGLLAFTLDDLTGTADDPRPTRWWALSVLGAFVYALPLAWRELTARRHVVVGAVSVAPAVALGLGAAAACSVAAFLLTGPVELEGGTVDDPGTAYFSTAFAPDYFGQHKDVVDDARAAAAARLWAAMAEDGVERVVGPIELLAHPVPDLVRLPLASTTGDDDRALFDASLAWWIDRGYDHVVLRADAPPPGDPRLERIGESTPAGSAHGFTWYRATR